MSSNGTISIPEQPAIAESIIAFGDKPKRTSLPATSVSIITVLPLGLSDSNCIPPFQCVVTIFDIFKEFFVSCSFKNTNNKLIKYNKMPLVTPLSADYNKETQELAEFFNETLGFCPNSVLTMQRRPAISKAFINLNKAVMVNEGRVTSALKRMIAWVSSNSSGCRYCQAHAIRAADRYGAEQEQLDNIWEYRTHPAFSEAERAALDFSLAASQIPNSVDEKIKEELYKYWDEGEIVEMLGVISLFGYLNRWNDSMGTSIEEGAVESGEQYLGKHGWEKGKHG